MTTRRRIAITGIGLVTPVGNDAPTSWANLINGQNGIGLIRQFDASGFSARIGAEVNSEHAGANAQAQAMRIVRRRPNTGVS